MTSQVIEVPSSVFRMHDMPAAGADSHLRLNSFSVSDSMTPGLFMDSSDRSDTVVRLPWIVRQQGWACTPGSMARSQIRFSIDMILLSSRVHESCAAWADGVMCLQASPSRCSCAPPAAQRRKRYCRDRLQAQPLPAALLQLKVKPCPDQVKLHHSCSLEGLMQEGMPVAGKRSGVRVSAGGD